MARIRGDRSFEMNARPLIKVWISGIDRGGSGEKGLTRR